MCLGECLYSTAQMTAMTSNTRNSDTIAQIAESFFVYFCLDSLRCAVCAVSLPKQEWDGLRTTKDRVVVIASTNR